MGRKKNHFDDKWLKAVAGYTSDPLEALEDTISLSNEGDIVVVTGSLYLVGQLLSEYQAKY